MRAVLPPSRTIASRRPLDRACLVLLRLVLADGWRVEPAGRAMRALVHGDRQLLRLLHAHVARAMLDRPTAVDARALATLEQALAMPPRSTSLGRTA